MESPFELLAKIRSAEASLYPIAEKLGCSIYEAPERVRALVANVNELENENRRLKERLG